MQALQNVGLTMHRGKDLGQLYLQLPSCVLLFLTKADYIPILSEKSDDFVHC